MKLSQSRSLLNIIVWQGKLMENLNDHKGQLLGSMAACRKTYIRTLAGPGKRISEDTQRALDKVMGHDLVLAFGAIH